MMLLKLVSLPVMTYWSMLFVVRLNSRPLVRSTQGTADILCHSELSGPGGFWVSKCTLNGTGCGPKFSNLCSHCAQNVQPLFTIFLTPGSTKFHIGL